jgi:hypothetical protein
LNNLHNQINFFEREILNADRINTAVSQANIGWHIAHCNLVMVSIINVLVSSNPEEFSTKFNWRKTLIFLTKKVPRGKAKAPDRVKPREILTKEMLINQIEEVKQKIKLLDGLHKNVFFTHPYFGNLNLKETKFFLDIHNNHHYKIIKDILK